MDYYDVEWFALETNQDHSVAFEVALKHCISNSFVDYDGHSTFFLGILAHSSRYSELDLPILIHLSSSIPNMLVFNPNLNPA